MSVYMSVRVRRSFLCTKMRLEIVDPIHHVTHTTPKIHHTGHTKGIQWSSQRQVQKFLAMKLENV